MINLLLKMMPEQMAKYEYVYRLLKPVREWIQKVDVQTPPFPWPLPKPILWSALIRAAEDLKSVNLLARLQQLQAIVEKLEDVNKHWDNNDAAIDVLFQLRDELPIIDRQINRHRIANWLKATAIFALLATLVVLITFRISQCA